MYKKLINNKNYLFIGIGILIVFIIFISLVCIISKIIKSRTKTKTKHKHHGNRIKGVIGLEVYDSNGNELGKVKEVFLEGDKPKMHGVLVKINKSLYKKIKMKTILIKKNSIQSMGNVILIHGDIFEIINKLKSHEEKK